MQRILIIIFLIAVNHFMYGLSTQVQQKYSNVLHTDDYGILNEADLLHYQNNPEDKNLGNKLFWQCFARDDIDSIELSEDLIRTNMISPSDNASELKIVIHDYSKSQSDNKEITYEYYSSVAHAEAISTNKTRMHNLEQIINNQKYVCFGGRNALIDPEIKKTDGITTINYVLTLEGAKSKSGDCFDSCIFHHKYRVQC
jgi:hypothetical protein